MIKLLNVNKNLSVRIAELICVLLLLFAAAFGQQQTTQDRVAAFKQSLTKNQTELRKYQWVETTTVSLKGEVKSTTQKACYYGADGKVQKNPMADSTPEQPAQSGGRGGRFRQKVVANKKAQMSDYMKKAVALVGQYVPPDPDLIKYSKETNNIKIEPVEMDKTIRLSFPNFIKNGDMMSATLNIVSNTIVNVNISTYLDSPKDAISVSVVFTQLNDGTNYAGTTTLNAPAKNIVVVVENSGHRPL